MARALLLVGWVASVAGMAGCDLIAASPLDVDVALDNDWVSTSHPIQVVVTVTNSTDRAVTLDPRACPRRFEIWDVASGRIDSGPVECRLTEFAPVGLRPGESFRYFAEWAGRRLGGSQAALPPGDYELRGWVLANERLVEGGIAPVRVVKATP